MSSFPPAPQYPAKGDRLFESQPPKAPNAEDDFNSLIGLTHEVLFPHHARRSYYRAAQIIAERIAADLEESKPMEPALWLPMAYNFRHYIELSLKAMLRKASLIAAREPDIDVQLLATKGKKAAGDHPLLPLWDGLMEILKAILLPKDFHEADQVVGDLVRELHDWDPRSTFFRYPTDRDGHAHPEESLPAIEIEPWVDVTGRLHHYIEAWDTYLDVLIAAQEDHLATLPSPDG